MRAKKSSVVLLVEDNPGDVRLMEEAFSETGFPINLHIVENGTLALAFLRRSDRFSEAPRPDLILLDLNLPKTDGREVLVEIKGDESLKTIPVVVLTTSQSEQDILRAYQLHANCYIAKPVELERFMRVMKSIQEFWLDAVILPPQ